MGKAFTKNGVSGGKMFAIICVKPLTSVCEWILRKYSNINALLSIMKCLS